MNLEKGEGSWQSIGVLARNALMAGTWQSRGEPRGSKISQFLLPRLPRKVR
jgi:hypothetical protein